jgi:hypothetical protein
MLRYYSIAVCFSLDSAYVLSYKRCNFIVRMQNIAICSNTQLCCKTYKRLHYGLYQYDVQTIISFILSIVYYSTVTRLLMQKL